MFHTRFRRLSITLALVMSLMALFSPAASTASAADSTHPVIAYYYGWWGPETWHQIYDQPVTLYKSNDDNVVRNQIRQAKSAGIDGFLCTWRYNCQRLLQLAQAEGGFSVAFSVDPVADESLNSFDAVVKQMREMSGLTSNPAYLRWNGKPLFAFWNNTILPGDSSIAAFQHLRESVDPKHEQFWLGGGIDFSYLDVYDAIHFFDITWETSQGAAMISYNRKLNDYNKSHGASKPFVATVMPGYNDIALRNGHARDRENGNYYRAGWDTAMSYKAQAVIINSWNEWYEGSEIEPSQTHGTLYLDITRDKIGQYRALPPSIADEAFQRTWNRTDKPVQDARATRSWVWGSPRTDGIWESYNSGGRLVQYFDKSRMEINNPSGDRTSQWFVTNGLLAQELITGRLQLGDSSFEQRKASDEVLSGDPRTVNANVPGYSALGSYLGRMPNRSGTTVNQQLFRAGNIGPVDPPVAVDYSTYINETGHNIPGIFWDFMNQQGLIWNGSSFVTGQVVDWLFAFGYPITDAYWIRAKVGGVEKWVLAQAFERRVLTYTPSNAPEWRVEMGNVGQHYHQWRYGW